MPRQKLKLDEATIAQLAFDGASNREIAAILGVDEGTIRADRFSALLTKKRAERRIGLRKLQMKAAKAGNATLLIWLGKNELGQADQPAADDTPDADPPHDADGKPIPV